MVNKECRGSMKNCKVNFGPNAFTDYKKVKLDFLVDVKKMNDNASRLWSDLCDTLLDNKINSVKEVLCPNYSLLSCIC